MGFLQVPTRVELATAGVLAYGKLTIQVELNHSGTVMLDPLIVSIVGQANIMQGVICDKVKSLVVARDSSIVSIVGWANIMQGVICGVVKGLMVARIFR